MQRCQAFYDNEYILPKVANIPIELYESIKGQYFLGYADNLTFGTNTGAWAMLYNPVRSGVKLYVNVWTITDVIGAPFTASFWFNSEPPGEPSLAASTPTNTSLFPAPVSKVQLQYASNVKGEPEDGIKAFIRRSVPGNTLVESENGKLIFPPGGSFLVYLNAPEAPGTKTSGRVALGWWEESVCDRGID